MTHSKYRVSETKLDTHFGLFDFYCFSWGEHEEDNLLCQAKPWSHEPVLVRVQSACYTSEIFRSLDCDCHEQLETSLRLIQDRGGLLVYMLCDGRGAGIFDKVRGLELGQIDGLDTSDAYRALGLEQDPRTYDRVAEAIRYFNIQHVRLLTNNPRKVKGLESKGIRVTREPLLIEPTDKSRSYLETKRDKMDHMLNQL